MDSLATIYDTALEDLKSSIIEIEKSNNRQKAVSLMNVYDGVSLTDLGRIIEDLKTVYGHSNQSIINNEKEA